MCIRSLHSSSFLSKQNTSVFLFPLSAQKIKPKCLLSLFFLHLTRDDIPVCRRSLSLRFPFTSCHDNTDVEVSSGWSGAALMSCCSAGLQSLMIYWHTSVEQTWTWFIGAGERWSGRSLDFASSHLFIIHEQRREAVYVWTSERRWLCERLDAYVLLFC